VGPKNANHHKTPKKASTVFPRGRQHGQFYEYAAALFNIVFSDIEEGSTDIGD
jgi:hypothetical protein